MKAKERITTAAIDVIKSVIDDASGREVLFLGHQNENEMIIEVEVIARGHLTAVAVPQDLFDAGNMILHNHPSGVLSPSDADLTVAAALSEFGVGTAIIDNRCREIYVIMEPTHLSGITRIDTEEIRKTLEEGGAVARTLPGFVPRESQLGMTEQVAAAFNDGALLAVEAGTGVGKSFAYLLPALEWVRNNDERIVISTATINLQEQLMEKDIPFLQKALGTSIPVALVKGRGNYLCPRRLQEYSEAQDLFTDKGELINALKEWAERTETGDRSELPFFVSDEIWSSLGSEHDTCSPARCEHRERCFIWKARHRAGRARILVANHHIVFSDLAVRRSGFGWEQTAILPPFHRIIVDEAHNLERNATSFFSESVSSVSLRRQTARLSSRRGTRRQGLLERILELDADETLQQAVIDDIGSLRDRLESFTTAALLFLGETSTFRLTEETYDTYRTVLGDLFFSVQQGVLALADGCGALYKSISEERREEQAAFELSVMKRRFETFAAVFQKFRTPDFSEEVLWLERVSGSRLGSYVRVVVTPLDVKIPMRETLFDHFETVVCTSATLAINESFLFWASRTGFPVDTGTTGIFSSPFPYSSRVLTAIPRDAVAPTDDRYPEYLENMISRLVGDRGAALVLFTSYRLLNDIFDAVKPEFEERGITLYRQGDDDRTRLLQSFRNDVSSVLFATDSFWEGIDVPGDALRLVILSRLPFRVPTDPVQQARAELLDKTGGNAFMDMSLPQAIFKLKQGFGRLMRKDTDYGVVVITDSRIVEKWYGRMFFTSLPETRRELLPGEELVGEVHSFLRRFEKEKE